METDGLRQLVQMDVHTPAAPAAAHLEGIHTASLSFTYLSTGMRYEVASLFSVLRQATIFRQGSVKLHDIVISKLLLPLGYK